MTNAWLPLMRRRPIVRVAKDLPKLSQPDDAPHEVKFVWGMRDYAAHLRSSYCMSPH